MDDNLIHCLISERIFRILFFPLMVTFVLALLVLPTLRASIIKKMKSLYLLFQLLLLFLCLLCIEGYEAVTGKSRQD